MAAGGRGQLGQSDEHEEPHEAKPIDQNCSHEIAKRKNTQWWTQRGQGQKYIGVWRHHRDMSNEIMKHEAATRHNDEDDLEVHIDEDDREVHK